MDIMNMVGFLDGIDESLVTPNNIEEMDENTEVSLLFDKKKLYKKVLPKQESKLRKSWLR